MKKKVIAAVAVCAAIAAVCGLAGQLIPQKQPAPVLDGLHTSVDETTDWDRVIAYVPLDDRTDNMEDVVYLAEASGYRIVLPEGDLYCTKLDGQKPNQNGTQYGDREALMTWVREMDQRGCDRFVLSLDQLFSGGLVNSRSISEPQTYTFADGTTLNEAEAFEAYILSLSNDPDNHVYLFDSVVRLAPTVGYLGFGTEEYYGLREYGMVTRPMLDDEDLTPENIFAQYPYAADGVTPAENALGSDRFRSVLTEENIADYLKVRRRKLQLMDTVIAGLKTAPNDNIQLLIGIDDSSNTANIQYNELRYIQRQLGEGTTLLSGLDSLARLLVGRIAQEQYDYHVKTAVTYIGGTQGIPSSEYDLYTLEEVANQHMDLFRAVRVPEEEAELQILMMTAPDDPAKAADYCEELVSRIEYNEAHHIPTALIEASNNAYGDLLEQMLFERVDFTQLVAFAGKYDQAVVTGAGFAMAFSRYLYLQCCEEKQDRCDVAQVQQIANSLILTYPYILHARAPLNQYIQELGANYNNIQPNAAADRKIARKVDELFRPGYEAVCENLQGKRVISQLEPYAEKQVTGVSVSDVYFPWRRTFEISFTIHVDALKPIA